MDTQRLFEWFGRRARTIRLYAAPLLLLFVGLVFVLVYETGGIKYVYSHSMYIPILLSGIIFGIRGGIFFGMLAGLVLGPFMPINVATGEMQEPVNWLYRTGFFTLIGFLSGAASDGAESYMSHLKWLSLHNRSTKLPNRSALFDKLAELAETKHAPGSYTLFAVSIENQRELKSAFGFAVVDQAVRQLAPRFENNRTDRHVYHTETAQVAILIACADQEMEQCLDELVADSREPILYDDIPIHLDLRMGYVTLDRVDDAPEVYLQRADAALTVACEREQECIAYSPAILTVADENLSILGELKDALRDGQLLLHYQPKVDIKTGKVHGVEALMRWNHPVRGDIPPGTFIPRAEQSTLIQLVTEFALDQAMAQMLKWQRAGINISIAVNISPQNLLAPGFTDLVFRLLERHGLSGEKLELEVTERALMLDIDHAIGELVRLADAKLEISIDDFGTGYSSLQYLHRMPISLIKIDQSFVRGLPADQGAAYIVDAAVALAHKMGIRTIAEGIENQQTLDYLGNVGCDMVQGFFVSKPLSAENFEQWYKHWHEKEASILHPLV